MKKFLLFLTAFVATVASGALLDVKVPQQALASPPTWTDRVVPFESAISTTLASYRSGAGLGTEDSPAFTGLTLSGLTDTRVVLAGVGGLLGGDADLTFSGTRLTATDLTVTNFPTFTAGTATRVPFFTTAGLVTDDSDMTFATDTLTVTKGTFGGITHVANAIASANSLASAALSPLTLGTGTFGTAVSFASATGIGTFTAAPSAPSYASTVATGTAPFVVASTTQVANLNAATAGSSTNAGITDDTTTNAAMYPVWVTANTGNLPLKVTSTKLTYNPSTGAFSAGSGSITGGAISGTTGTFSSGSDLTMSLVGTVGTYSKWLIGVTPVGDVGSANSLLSGASASDFSIAVRGANKMRVGVNGAGVADFTSTGLNNTVIGATTAAAGSFTTLAASGQISVSTLGTGTSGQIKMTRTGVASRYLTIGGSGEIIIGDTDGTNGVTINDAARGTWNTTGLAVTGTLGATGIIYGGVQALSGAGAVDVTNQNTDFTSTGGAQALTLANGTAGQTKTICHVTDGGSGVLTPTTKTGFTTITFTNAGDSVTLRYSATGGWYIVGIFGAVAA